MLYPLKWRKSTQGECINIMTQALQIADGSLLQSVTVQNAYTELHEEAARM